MQLPTSSGEPLRVVLDERVLAAADLLIAGEDAADTGNHERALAFFDQLLSQLGDSDDLLLRADASAVPGVEPLMAIALARKARELQTVGRYDDVLGVVDELLRRFGGSVDPAIRLQVADGLWDRKLALAQLERRDLAIGVCDELIERFSDAEELFLLSFAARAMVEKAFNMELLGRLDEAIAVYRDVIARYGQSDVPELSERAAKSRINAANLLAMGRSAKELSGELASATDLERVALSARALVAQAETALSSDSPNEAIEFADIVITALELRDELAIRKVVALALWDKFVALNRLGSDPTVPFETIISSYGTELLAVFDEETTRLQSAVAPDHLNRLSTALLAKATILGGLGRESEARVALKGLLKRFDGNTTPGVAQALEAARELLAQTTGTESD